VRPGVRMAGGEPARTGLKMPRCDSEPRRRSPDPAARSTVAHVLVRTSRPARGSSTSGRDAFHTARLWGGGPSIRQLLAARADSVALAAPRTSRGRGSRFSRSPRRQARTLAGPRCVKRQYATRGSSTRPRIVHPDRWSCRSRACGCFALSHAPSREAGRYVESSR
jgi:hypothetical protein